MDAKTDKNFIYDYLIHLDSYILHGVSEIGVPTQKNIPVNTSNKETNHPPLKNKQSPVAFIAGDALNTDEHELFSKIVVAMGLNPNDIYLTSINKSKSNSLALITEEITHISSKYIVCLGEIVANNFSALKTDYGNSQSSWQNLNLFNRDIILVTIPAVAEMLADPRHKKAAWAHLKKAADQIQEN